MRVYLISACVGDHVPGRELADPDCPNFPGLVDRPDVQAWFAEMGYGADDDELVYLLTDDDPEDIPDGFPFLTVEV
jgi:hypothetical protein